MYFEHKYDQGRIFLKPCKIRYLKKVTEQDKDEGNPEKKNDEQEEIPLCRQWLYLRDDDSQYVKPERREKNKYKWVEVDSSDEEDWDPLVTATISLCYYVHMIQTSVMHMITGTIC